MQETTYLSPKMETYEIVTEGVLCSSNDDLELDMNPEDGYM